MAYKVGASAGLWSAAATWESVTNTPTIHASTNLTVDGTARYTAAFTAPNTTNAATGVLIYVNAVGSAGTLTATLQEGGADTTAAISVSVTSLKAAAWNYLRLPSAYTWTTTGAGAYRWKIAITGGSGTTNAGADSGGTTYAYLSTDSRTGAPATTDDVLIAAAITVDGAQSVGGATLAVSSITAATLTRYLGYAVHIVSGGVLAWDTASSATLTMRGCLIVASGGEMRMGTAASPMPAASVATLAINLDSTQGKYAIIALDGGRVQLHGSSHSQRTTVTSGAGTVASPLITAGNLGDVGDEVAFAPTGAGATCYDETEYRYIKTKNSTTSYVLSSTAGGAESALAYTHAGGLALNLSRNCVIRSTSTTYRYSCTLGLSSIAGDVDLSWARIDNCGAPASGAVYLFSYFNLCSVNTAGSISTVTDCVFDRHSMSAAASTLTGGTGPTMTLTRCYWTRSAGTGAYLNRLGTIMVGCVILDAQGSGLYLPNGAQISGTSIIAAARAGGSVYAVEMSNFTGNVFADCDFHANRAQIRTLLTGHVFRSCRFGTLGDSGATYVVPPANSNSQVLFDSCTFGSAALVSGYASMSPGSELAFHRLNAADNAHRWYTPAGVGSSEAVTVRTAGSLAVRLAPENSTTGLVWEFNILAKAGAIVSFVGFLRRNAALGTDAATVELFLPGSTVADASYALPSTSDTWLPVAISALYSGAVDLLATVRITVKSTAAGAYLYADDFYNAGTTNKIAGLDTWDKGKPVGLLVDTTFDPASVWAFSTAQLTTAGTTGKQLMDALTLAKFIGLK